MLPRALPAALLLLRAGARALLRWHAAQVGTGAAACTRARAWIPLGTARAAAAAPAPTNIVLVGIRGRAPPEAAPAAAPPAGGVYTAPGLPLAARPASDAIQALKLQEPGERCEQVHNNIP